jgi:hypothetical protein
MADSLPYSVRRIATLGTDRLQRWQPQAGKGQQHIWRAHHCERDVWPLTAQQAPQRHHAPCVLPQAIERMATGPGQIE